MKKILVTGGNGYIGSHTIIELIKNGNFEVVSVDNYSRSSEGTMDRIEQITGKKVLNYNIDLCQRSDVLQLFETEKQIDGIIHFAAFKSVPESVEQPLQYYRNNLNSLSNILEACEIYHVPHLIFSSSCSIYGEVKKLPVTEETPAGEAFCPYAHTKQIGETMIRCFAKIHPDLQTVLLRYFNPVGADMSGKNGELSYDQPNNLFPILMETGIGIRKQMTVYGTDYDTRDGSCIRDYIHVSDIADAHIKALQYLINQENKSNCEVFNLGSGNGVSVLEMIHAFEKITGRKLNYTLGERRPGDIPAIFSNSSKAQTILHWECRYGIEDMILSAWKWQNELIAHL